MDIRTKLIFAFVTATLASMLVLGVFFYRASSEILQSISARQLESLAAARQQDLKIVAQGWFDQVRLISSRTKLRDSLKQYTDHPTDALRESIQRILRDAESSVGMVAKVALYDLNNKLVASSGAAKASLQQITQQTGQHVLTAAATRALELLKLASSLRKSALEVCIKWPVSHISSMLRWVSL